MKNQAPGSSHLAHSEVSECLFFSPVLLVCLAKDKVDDQAGYVNGSCNEENISPTQFWILETGNTKL